MTFIETVRICLKTPELVSEYDRLRGSNLSRKGTGLDLLIDDSTGRTKDEMRGFVQFVWEHIWTPCVSQQEAAQG